MKKEVQNKIFELSDIKYKEFQSKLCHNINNIVRVRIQKICESYRVCDSDTENQKNSFEMQQKF